MKKIALLGLITVLAGLALASVSPIYRNWATTDPNPFAVRGIHQTGATTNGATMVVTLASVYTNYLYIPANAFMPESTAAAAVGTYSPSGTDNSAWDVMDYDDTTAEWSDVVFALPTWDMVDIRYRVHWTSASTTAASGVLWRAYVWCMGDDETLGSLLDIDDVNDVTDSWGGTANKLRITDWSSTMTLGHTNASKFAAFALGRAPAQASDTMVGDARMIGVTILYTSTNHVAW